MHNSSRNSATIIRKFRDQGSKFRHETKGLLPSFDTIQEVHFQNVPLFPYGKTKKDFLIVAYIIVAETSATIIRKFRDQGSKFSNETQRVCLRPLLLFWKSFVVSNKNSILLQFRDILLISIIEKQFSRSLLFKNV